MHPLQLQLSFHYILTFIVMLFTKPKFILKHCGSNALRNAFYNINVLKVFYSVVNFPMLQATFVAFVI